VWKRRTRPVLTNSDPGVVFDNKGNLIAKVTAAGVISVLALSVRRLIIGTWNSDFSAEAV
jgi:hypothetical protein